MSKALVLSEEQWLKLQIKLCQDYPLSVVAIRWKMKEVLGFTTRTHKTWIDQEVDLRDIRYNTKYQITNIHLDFYNEPKRTMFLLKYSEYLQK
jgi:hypothetical protein